MWTQCLYGCSHSYICGYKYTHWAFGLWRSNPACFEKLGLIYKFHQAWVGIMRFRGSRLRDAVREEQNGAWLGGRNFFYCTWITWHILYMLARSLKHFFRRPCSVCRGLLIFQATRVSGFRDFECLYVSRFCLSVHVMGSIINLYV